MNLMVFLQIWSWFVAVSANHTIYDAMNNARRSYADLQGLSMWKLKVRPYLEEKARTFFCGFGTQPNFRVYYQYHTRENLTNFFLYWNNRNSTQPEEDREEFIKMFRDQKYWFTEVLNPVQYFVGCGINICEGFERFMNMIVCLFGPETKLTFDLPVSETNIPEGSRCKPLGWFENRLCVKYPWAYKMLK
ncbi:hypothetical protein B9Z55_024121 [Caenorhabditis nigoni]|uniref:SCP domain-containing protein n=2 Tax=Caenorhabditis nigoni TaxID=1611254 RepID=A0A2G5SSV3_9PELO|nr:hypothetical protein B9Z55_024121 [Caenorhabditis nigoni]